MTYASGNVDGNVPRRVDSREGEAERCHEAGNNEGGDDCQESGSVCGAAGNRGLASAQSLADLDGT